MKKKFLWVLMSVFCICSMMAFYPTKKSNTSASAYTANENTYTISNSTETLSVTYGTAATEVASNLSSLALAFEAISTHSGGTNAEIYFNNVSITTEETLEIDSNYLFAGSLTYSSTQPIFEINNPSTENTLNLYFKDFILTNNVENSEKINLIEVASTSNPAKITLENSDLNLNITNSPAVEDNTYAIYFNSTGHTIHFEIQDSHSTKFLYNYLTGINITVNKDTFYVHEVDGELEPLPLSDKFYISIPYYIDHETLYTDIGQSNTARFKALAENDTYSVHYFTSLGTAAVTSSFNLTLNTNGGSYVQDYYAPEEFYFKATETDAVTFPNASNITKEHYHFDGWFGQIEHNSQTYYFDQTALNAFINAGISVSNIETYFKTNLDSFSSSTSFAGHDYAHKDTHYHLERYDAVRVFAELEKPVIFSAKWNLNTRTLNFNTNGGSLVNSYTYAYGAKVTEPTTPTKSGYYLAGWSENENLLTLVDFSTYTMPDRDVTFYAKWEKATFTINFVTYSNDVISVQSYLFEETLNLPTSSDLTKIGCVFAGWYEDADFETAFNDTTMRAENLTLYAKWTAQILHVSFNSNGGAMIPYANVEYGTEYKRPTNPTRLGYTFDGWYKDSACTVGNQVEFLTKTGPDPYEYIVVTKDTYYYAKWLISEFTLDVYNNISNTNATKLTFDFGDSISLPTNLTKANHKFGGWFTSADFSEKFTLTTMPATNISAYAKWIEKPQVEVFEDKQIYTTDTINPSFENFSEYNGFNIKYFFDGEWKTYPPSEIGTYDVMITRNEDENFSRYSKVLEGAFVIEPKKANFTWVAIILAIIGFIEIALSIFVRKMRKMKFNMIASFAIIIGNSYLPTGQVIAIAITGVFMIFGAILLIHELVQLHRTIPEDFAKKKDDENQETEMGRHFKFNEEHLNVEVNQYSAADIKAMLENDTVGEKIKTKHNLNNTERTDVQKSTSVAASEQTHELYEEVIVADDDEFIANTNEEKYRNSTYDSEDLFVRRDPNDYTSDNANDKNE